MIRGPWVVGVVFYLIGFASAGRTFAAGETQKLEIIYASFTGAYTPLRIAVEEEPGKKHGLEPEAVYAGKSDRISYW